MVTRGRVARGVGSALAAQKAEKLDDGTVALARTYAELIDNAAPAAKYVKHIDALRLAVDELDRLDPLAVESGKVREALDAVIVALSAHSVASDLGPKLLAALTALGLTPVARRAAMGGSDAPKPAGPVDELRERRRTRAERAR